MFTKIASVGASSAAGGNITTAGINTTGADFIAAHVADYAGEVNAAVVTDSNGNTYTPQTAASDSTLTRSRWHFCFAPIVGAGHTFTASSASTVFPSIQVIAFSGGLAYDQIATALGSGVTSRQPGSLTPPSNNALFLVGICFDGTTGTVSINSGFTKEVENPYVVSNAFGGAVAYFIQGTAGALNPTWSWTNSVTVATSMATVTTTGAAPRFILGTH